MTNTLDRQRKTAYNSTFAIGSRTPQTVLW